VIVRSAPHAVPVVHAAFIPVPLLASRHAAAPEPLAGSFPASCRRTTWDEIAGLFSRWNDALATHDPDQVVANYTRDAMLLPTVSNVPRTSPAEIRDYFEHFLEKSPTGRIDRRIIRIRCNTASDTGLYTFTLHESDGLVHQVAARYSFLYEFRNGKWLIAHHHSSVMPEPVAATGAPPSASGTATIQVANH